METEKMKEAKFGTGGIRGIMGEDIDEDIIKTATYGLSDYLLKNSENPSVAVSYDSRNNSRKYAEITCRALQEKNIDAFLFSEMMPVPVLSFAVRHMKCDAGIMITASHNSREYNGYKVYNSTGGQVLDEEAAAIEKEIKKIMQSEGTASAFESECLNSGDRQKYSLTNISSRDKNNVNELHFISDSVYMAYKEAMNECSDFTDEREISIIYTPLNGSGRMPVTEMFDANGFTYTMVPEQTEENGDFPTCTYPNPEKKDVYRLAEHLAAKLSEEEKGSADIIIATDPDCDRIGIEVLHEGKYQLISGNDIGILLSYFACETGRKGTFVCSIVSTPLTEKVVEKYDSKVIRTPVGFKYIGEKITEYEDDYVFGFEESNGVLVGNYARDKDGVVGAKLLAQMAAYYKKHGMTLVDVLNEISERFGKVFSDTVHVDVSDNDEKDRIMKNVRNNLPENKQDSLKKVIDYSGGIDGYPPLNMIIAEYKNGSRMIIRPSGTEPKIKLYLSANLSEDIDKLKSIFESCIKD